MYRYYHFHIPGQIPSGKNAVITTRTGHRFPQKRFVAWREHALKFLKIANKASYLDHTIKDPVDIVIKYTASDKRRRDVPGMIDAIWHVLEKALVVSDDTHLGSYKKMVIWKNEGIDKTKAGVKILIREMV